MTCDPEERYCKVRTPAHSSSRHLPSTLARTEVCNTCAVPRMPLRWRAPRTAEAQSHDLLCCADAVVRVRGQVRIVLRDRYPCGDAQAAHAVHVSCMCWRWCASSLSAARHHVWHHRICVCRLLHCLPACEGESRSGAQVSQSLSADAPAAAQFLPSPCHSHVRRAAGFVRHVSSDECPILDDDLDGPTSLFRKKELEKEDSTPVNLRKRG